jgi:hypothetical protein
MTASTDKTGATPAAACGPYEKPKVTRIKLDARCAVLGFCKTGGTGGPVRPGCEDAFFESCSGPGS